MLKNISADRHCLTSHPNTLASGQSQKNLMSMKDQVQVGRGHRQAFDLSSEEHIPLAVDGLRTTPIDD
jgi:hypothetical protein